MTGTIWWLWLGATGFGFLLIFGQMFYALQKSFGIFSALVKRKGDSKIGRPRLSASKSVGSPQLNAANDIELSDADLDNDKFCSPETDSGDFSDVLDQASEGRPLRWVRACACKVNPQQAADATVKMLFLSKIIPQTGLQTCMLSG